MKCFVIMPFGNRLVDPRRASELDLLYDELIKPAIESVTVPGRPTERLICHRGDKECAPGEIITHIVENLVLADIAIADLSGRNPNVFYELGVRHAVNDNTILIAQAEEEIPFDLRGQRYIIYQCDFEGGVRLRNALVRTVEDILKAPRKIDNPVRRYLYDQEKDKIEARGTPPGYDIVKELLSEIGNLRNDFKGQLNDIRRIMNVVTSPPGAPVTQDSSTELNFLEGVWKSSTEGSVICAHLVSGRILMPYCYGGNSHLSAHIYNVRLIGPNLLARFRWLRYLQTSGYVYFKIESNTRLVGGWWYSEDVPDEMTRDIARIDHSIPGMHKWVLEKVPSAPFPAWAEEYFKKGKREEFP
jgi:hypothetical protein